MGNKKFNCKDCFFCQWCSDERCRLCRGTLNCTGECVEKSLEDHGQKDDDNSKLSSSDSGGIE